MSSLLEMVYDGKLLDDFRNVARGQFRDDDNKVPFLVDPHDLSSIWFPAPETGRVRPVAWRGSFFTDAPMTDTIVQAVRRRVRERGGNHILSRGSAQRQILDELTELTSGPVPTDWTAKLSAAHRRVEQSRKDHEEAQAAKVQPATKPLSRAATKNAPRRPIPIHPRTTFPWTSSTSRGRRCGPTPDGLSRLAFGLHQNGCQNHLCTRRLVGTG